MVAWVRRNPGWSLLVLGLALAAALYAPTLGRGLVNYDDTWLVRDNHVLRHPSWSSLAAVFDPAPASRLPLGAEYLPVRDLSIMADLAVWGDHYQGLHLVNLVVYLASIALVFAMLDGFGTGRTVAGLAALIWAIHPSHAESVAWISERKGLLGMMFAAACGLGFARFRAGRGAGWLVLAAACAVCATWSKATCAFAVAALAGLELALPARRRSWPRSLVGLAAIGAAAGLAFVPVLAVATSTAVVSGAGRDPALVFGVHGFYVRLAAMAMPNAISYPIATDGPSPLDIGLGAVALVAIAACVLRAPWPELGAGAWLWLWGWLPVSDAVIRIQKVVVADRYALVPTLGLALAAAAAITRIASARARTALVATLVVTAGLRTLDAQASWASPRELWARAVDSNPRDGAAWSLYAEALDEAGDPQLALAVTERGLAAAPSPRLVLRQALLLRELGHRAEALPLFRRAAEAGEAIAMSDLALLELDGGGSGDALAWARRGSAAAPGSAHAWRTHGKVALAAGQPDEALDAFRRAFRLEPDHLGNRYNLALALIALHREADARADLEACLSDPVLGPRARAMLGR